MLQDVEALRSLIDRDVEELRVPVMVVAANGTLPHWNGILAGVSVLRVVGP